MQFPQISDPLQVLDPLDEIIAQIEVPQLLILLQREDGSDTSIGQLDLVDASVIVLARGLDNGLPLHRFSNYYNSNQTNHYSCQQKWEGKSNMAFII
jgi:hypothetical protein